MKVTDAIIEVAEREGFDGLFHPDGECACTWDDLAPCGTESFDCVFGYRAPCDCGGHDFHISSEKPEER